ncbi:MAG TPA: hypothetical protein VGC46_07730 [Allosphingosinicella sp.]
MIKDSLVFLRSIAGAAALVAGVLATAPAGAQDGNVTIGAPQLRDFQIEPKQRIVTQPAQPPRPVATTTQPAERPSPTQVATPTDRPVQQRPAPASRPSSTPSAPVAAAPTASPTATLPAADASTTQAAPLPAPEAAPVAAPQAPAGEPGNPLSDGPPLWMFFLAFVAVGLGGYGYWLRRQAAGRRALAVASGAPAPTVQAPRPPAAPRPAPIPRPWLDIALIPEKARVDLEQSVIEFELTVRNTGGSVARDVKLQARFFCSTEKQDQELGAYFKAKPGDFKTLSMPDIPAGGEIVMKGSVDIKRDRISALKVEDKLLFVPVIGLNAFYAWGNSRSGQTSKSFVIGRQPDNDNEKMGPFRLDLGARVYRTIGQRPHKVSKRV